MVLFKFITILKWAFKMAWQFYIPSIIYTAILEGNSIYLLSSQISNAFQMPAKLMCASYLTEKIEGMQWKPPKRPSKCIYSQLSPGLPSRPVPPLCSECHPLLLSQGFHSQLSPVTALCHHLLSLYGLILLISTWTRSNCSYCKTKQNLPLTSGSFLATNTSALLQGKISRESYRLGSVSFTHSNWAFSPSPLKLPLRPLTTWIF